ncbi:MAG: hypothetical protein IJ312_01475 [Treponema sp.]|nr:hypothetical protein [Treponema sp.]
MNSELVSNVIIPRITEITGIIINPIHKKNIEYYIECKANESKISFEEYCNLLIPNSVEFEKLINAATTNETCFFREKSQFDFLKDKVFPLYKGKKLVIWSGACASGEEPISLYALATHCGVCPEIYASDIDSNELKLFKKGDYSKFSFNAEGKEFHHLLESSKCGTFKNEGFSLNKEIFDHIKINRFNLAGETLPDFFELADMIFIRNVFIYFDNNLRKKILYSAAKKLSPGGYIFLSVSEICCVGPELIPPSLIKINYGKVYFFVKKDGDNPFIKISNENKLAATKSSNSLSVDKRINKLKIKRNLNTQNLLITKDEKTTEKSSVKDVFSKLNELLSIKNYSAAEKLINSYEPSFSEQFYKEYFFALIYKSKNEFEVAERHFVLAETLKPFFWPSYFYHGIMLKDNGKNSSAMKYFENCIKYLETYINDEKTDFDFLTESFSPSYFYNLCKKLVLMGDENED